MTLINILPLPAFQDNYIWLLYDEITRNAWVVDPGDPRPVITTLKEYNLNLMGILITHHHQDHTGGIDELRKYQKNIAVFGSAKSPIKTITHHVKEGDRVDCSSLKLSVLEIPGHTLDHIAFYNSDMLFCGDTLFSAGCGKIFEGTAAQMLHSLNKITQLPENTAIYCGHEYTLANLQFAHFIEPNNELIIQKIAEVKLLREKNKPTLPSFLSTEKRLNPFLRCDQIAIIEAVQTYCHKTLNNAVEIFATLREWKNIKK
jgi:hydroxyacylglutathione hydrolase